MCLIILKTTIIIVIDNKYTDILIPNILKFIMLFIKLINKLNIVIISQTYI